MGEVWVYALKNGSVRHVYKKPSGTERDYLHVRTTRPREQIEECYVITPSGSAFTYQTTSRYERGVLQPKFYTKLLTEYVPNPTGAWEELKKSYPIPEFYKDEYADSKQKVMKYHKDYMKFERDWIKSGKDINDPELQREYQRYLENERSRDEYMHTAAHAAGIPEDEIAYRRSQRSTPAKRKAPGKTTARKKKSSKTFMDRVKTITGVRL